MNIYEVAIEFDSDKFAERLASLEKDGYRILFETFQVLLEEDGDTSYYIIAIRENAGRKTGMVPPR